LGERLLCKQEVVGSIPSGSTSRIDARPQETSFRAPRTFGFGRRRSARALSDIVKRGSIRKSRRGASRGRSTSKRCLTARALGSISKQAGLSVNADQVSAIRDQESESDFLIPDT
jgi:hypothetical protein